MQLGRERTGAAAPCDASRSSSARRARRRSSRGRSAGPSATPRSARRSVRRARSGPPRSRRNSNSVTMPKLPPPPRTPQKRSAFSVSLAVTSSPSAVIEVHRRAAGRSSARACACSHPMPPPSVRPATPGVRDDARRHREPERLRLAIELARAARRPAPAPCAPPGRRGSPSSAPRSITMPPSQTERPGKL